MAQYLDTQLFHFQCNAAAFCAGLQRPFFHYVHIYSFFFIFVFGITSKLTFKARLAFWNVNT
jgi:hypothetical protein